MIDNVSFLKDVPLFSNFSSNDLNILADAMEKEKVSEGDILIAEGTPGEALYVLVEGEVIVEKIFYDEKVKIASLKPGSIFGEMALVDNYPTSATVTATKNCLFYSLRKENLEHILAYNPTLNGRFWRDLSRILCNRIRAANDGLREYFIINQALISNEQFRELYSLAHGTPIK